MINFPFVRFNAHHCLSSIVLSALFVIGCIPQAHSATEERSTGCNGALAPRPNRAAVLWNLIRPETGPFADESEIERPKILKTLLVGTGSSNLQMAIPEKNLFVIETNEDIEVGIESFRVGLMDAIKKIADKTGRAPRFACPFARLIAKCYCRVPWA